MTVMLNEKENGVTNIFASTSVEIGTVDPALLVGGVLAPSPTSSSVQRFWRRDSWSSTS